MLMTPRIDRGLHTWAWLRHRKGPAFSEFLLPCFVTFFWHLMFQNVEQSSPKVHKHSPSHVHFRLWKYKRLQDIIVDFIVTLLSRLQPFERIFFFLVTSPKQTDQTEKSSYSHFPKIIKRLFEWKMDHPRWTVAFILHVAPLFNFPYSQAHRTKSKDFVYFSTQTFPGERFRDINLSW